MRSYESFAVSANKCWVSVGTVVMLAVIAGCGTHGWGNRCVTRSSPPTCCEPGPACDQSCTSCSDYPPAFPAVHATVPGLLGGNGMATPKLRPVESPVNVAPFPGIISKPETSPAIEPEEVDPMALEEEAEL